jgi:hypothetical protein
MLQVMSTSLGDAWSSETDLITCVTAMLECGRRFVWNFFRLENEHVNNCGNYRAVRDISLKPILKDEMEQVLKQLDDEHGMCLMIENLTCIVCSLLSVDMGSIGCVNNF